MVDAAETKIQSKKKKRFLELLTRFYKWLQENRLDKKLWIIFIYFRSLTTAVLGKVLVSKPGLNSSYDFTTKISLKHTESLNCSFLFSYLTTFVSWSKINLIFINGSLSTVQPGSVAADALPSGQEKDAREYFITPYKILPHHPNKLSATACVFWES